jgi:hypothetical protein
MIAMLVRVLALFIYLFLINACNLKVMARFTELKYIIGT